MRSKCMPLIPACRLSSKPGGEQVKLRAVAAARRRLYVPHLCKIPLKPRSSNSRCRHENLSEKNPVPGEDVAAKSAAASQSERSAMVGRRWPVVGAAMSVRTRSAFCRQAPPGSPGASGSRKSFQGRHARQASMRDNRPPAPAVPRRGTDPRRGDLRPTARSRAEVDNPPAGLQEMEPVVHLRSL